MSRGNPPQGNARPRNVLPMWGAGHSLAYRPPSPWWHPCRSQNCHREFYDRFGDKVTDELVNCLNSIEASYRAEIKDLFAAHFGRFEEKFEHRLAATQAELRVEIHSVKADLIKWTFVFWAPVAMAVIGLYFKT